MSATFTALLYVEHYAKEKHGCLRLETSAHGFGEVFQSYCRCTPCSIALTPGHGQKLLKKYVTQPILWTSVLLTPSNCG